MLLAGTHPALSTLREQLDNCVVAKRERDEFGYIAHFEIDPRVAAAPLPGWFNLTGVHAYPVPGLERGIGFRLYLEAGRLTLLEALTFDEPWPDTWPEEIPAYRLVYIEGGNLLDKLCSRRRLDS